MPGETNRATHHTVSRNAPPDQAQPHPGGAGGRRPLAPLPAEDWNHGPPMFARPSRIACFRRIHSRWAAAYLNLYRIRQEIREHTHLFASAPDSRRPLALTIRQHAVPRASPRRVLRRALRSPSDLRRFRPHRIRRLQSPPSRAGQQPGIGRCPPAAVAPRERRHRRTRPRRTQEWPCGRPLHGGMEDVLAADPSFTHEALAACGLTDSARPQFAVTVEGTATRRELTFRWPLLGL